MKREPRNLRNMLRATASQPKRTSRRFGVVPSSTYMKKVHRFIKGKRCEHNLRTHFPNDPNCPVCNPCKRNRAQCRQQVHGKPDDLPVPKKFADAITADHKISNEDDESRTHDRVAMIVLDRFTQWLQGYPCKTKFSDECVLNFQKFVGPQCKPEHVCTDNSKEFKSSLKELKWLHDTSTTHRSQTNGVVERAVRKLQEGSSCSLVQSGLGEAWWPEAMLCYCFLKNVVDVLRKTKQPISVALGLTSLGL